MQAYKGFNKDLTCRGFQYQEGETYKHDGDVVKCTDQGFHACEYPLDVFNYYAPACSVFHIVDLDGQIDKDSDGDSKVASAEITIKASITIPEMVQRSVDWIMSKIENTETNTGDYSAATNTGYQSAATNTGFQSAATNTGDCSAATNTGNRSAATVEGEKSVALASGRDSKASGSLGCAIFLVYRDFDYNIIHVRAEIIDGVTIKADTFYSLDEDGELVEHE